MDGKSSSPAAVRIEKSGPVTTVILDRAARRNAVDHDTAQALADAFRAFDADPEARVGVLFGAHGNFCAGADLKAIAAGSPNRVEPTGDGPMGPTRMLLDKPVVAAIAGHALILTGRPVRAEEALAMGLVNRVVPRGQAREAAEELAREIARFPQACLKSDRLSAYEAHDLPFAQALDNELRRGLGVLAEGAEGAARFAAGTGRHGDFGESF